MLTVWQCFLAIKTANPLRKDIHNEKACSGRPAISPLKRATNGYSTCALGAREDCFSKRDPRRSGMPNSGSALKNMCANARCVGPSRSVRVSGFAFAVRLIAGTSEIRDTKNLLNSRIQDGFSQILRGKRAPQFRRPARNVEG